MSNIPILCYHNVGPAPPDGKFNLLYTSVEKFERQLWTLRRLGLRGVAMRDGLAQLQANTSSDLVMLSFDDGYLDTVTRALPVLTSYGFTATCYLVSDAIGTHNSWDAALLQDQKPLMTQQQVQQWLAAGMEIGSHSCSHPRLAELSAMEAEREIAGSRAALRAALAVEIDQFAYPYGSFSAATIELVRRAGYVSAVTVEAGIAGARDDRYRLPRILVNGESGWLKFLLQVATPYEDLRRRRRRRSGSG
jgi:peptidoglycan/xylan/chitin deacetylase (PgdA/CDA1 family)